MRRTMPSAPGAVETWMRSSGWWKNWTAWVRSSVLPSRGTDAASSALAGAHAIQSASIERTGTANRRANDNRHSGYAERFESLLCWPSGRDKPFLIPAKRVKPSVPGVVPKQPIKHVILPAPVDTQIIAGVSLTLESGLFEEPY